MIKAANMTELSLIAQLAPAAVQSQSSGASFFEELNAAHGEVLRFSVLASHGPAPTGLSRKSHPRVLELRN